MPFEKGSSILKLLNFLPFKKIFPFTLVKVTMKLRPNSICWNPMEPFIFTCANEDYKFAFFEL